MKGDPTKPAAWANLLIRLWGPRFPVEVNTIALEFSKRFSDPIKGIQPAKVDRFEGALCPLPQSGMWAILYNPNISSIGRINFTLGHEFGHYLVHRHLSAKGFECGEARVLGYDQDAARRKMEQEADTFASYLLMPLDDYRAQIGKQNISLDLLKHCADRYGVSLTAAAIKWLDFTSECAALVVAENGFVLWCWRSKAAKRRGMFFPRGMELPASSWAANPSMTGDASGVPFGTGIWNLASEGREMAIFADRYEMTISLLVFEPAALAWSNDDDDETEEDVVDRIARHSR